VVGGTVQIITRMGGNVIVNVKESRIAIDEKMAQKIMI
jgi:ferrous iron transport protein A